MTALDKFEKYVTVVSSVDSLKSEVKRLAELVMQQQDRITRLETSGDLIAEKAKNAAMGAAHGMYAQLSKDLYEARAEIEQLKARHGSPAIQLPKSHFDGASLASSSNEAS
jgi:predicted RNase H-like nuclease (RuvC/YqgF family)